MSESRSMISKRTAILCLAIFLCSNNAHAVVTFEWATVGNPENGPDDTGYGDVSYTYRISKHEVTNNQYTEFLNAADPTGANTRDLYNPNMSSDANGGINFNSGEPNGSKYQVKSGRGDNPVNFVSFFDAMRFTNWLQNGQDNGSTESGVYRIGNGANERRNPSATYFIPSENEWYKAAYHKNDGVTANYWDYPTSMDTAPYSAPSPGNSAPIQSNTANFFADDGIANGYNNGFAVAGSSNLTDVGAYTASLSPYGTFDQGGNVFEWNEAVNGSSFRGLRGGSWDDTSIGLAASLRYSDIPFSPFPTLEFPVVGFRVANVPEPRIGLLGVLGMLGLMQRRQSSRWP